MAAVQDNFVGCPAILCNGCIEALHRMRSEALPSPAPFERNKQSTNRYIICTSMIFFPKNDKYLNLVFLFRVWVTVELVAQSLRSNLKFALRYVLRIRPWVRGRLFVFLASSLPSSPSHLLDIRSPCRYSDVAVASVPVFCGHCVGRVWLWSCRKFSQCLRVLSILTHDVVFHLQHSIREASC